MLKSAIRLRGSKSIKVFVRGVCEAAADAAIVRAVLYLGRSFGLAVIAEGVEADEQATRLRKKVCEEAQGYLFGRPVPAPEFAQQFDLSVSVFAIDAKPASISRALAVG